MDVTELPFAGRIPLKIKKCSRAADLLFEGRMRPAGHVLPTPGLIINSDFLTLLSKQCFTRLK